MPEFKSPVQVIIVKYECDNCLKRGGDTQGFMEYQKSDFVGVGIKGSVKHACNKCGVIMNLPKKYPSVEYKEI